MPDTRPGIKFVDGVCIACIHNEKQKETDWNKRWKELESLCEKYRGKNGNGWDCAIAVSGGKDSHFQTYIMKEKLKMNPVLLTVGNIDWRGCSHGSALSTHLLRADLLASRQCRQVLRSPNK